MKWIKLEKDKKKVNRRFHILAVLCICIFAIGITPKTLQNDTYYTITLGQYVLEHGIDMFEHFSWHEGLIYTYPHWLYDICMYGIYHMAGFQGIYISTIILGAILGISMYIVGSKISKNNIIAFLITILLMYVGASYIAARAQLVTFILFVWEIYFIEQFLDTRRWLYAFTLIFIPIVIANVHAAVFPFYFVLYLPYIGEYLIALIKNASNPFTALFLKLDKIQLDKLTKQGKLTEEEAAKVEALQKRIEVNEKRKAEKKKIKESKQGTEYKLVVEKRDNVKWLMIIMVICAFTGLLTPIGDTPYTYLYHTVKGNTTANIGEHLPLTLSENKEAIMMMVGYLILLTFTKVKIKLRDLFLVGGLMVLSFKTRRQLSMFYFVGGMILMRLISDFITIYDTKSNIEKAKQYMVSWVGQLVAYVLILLLTLALFLKIKDQDFVNDASYPVKASDYILEHMDLQEIRLFNDYNFGSYLMYRGIPEFIDSRADVYDPQFNGLEDDIFRDYINISGLNCDYNKKFDHYEITHVITYSNSKLALYMSKDSSHYKQMYKDDHFVIYQRITE